MSYPKVFASILAAIGFFFMVGSEGVATPRNQTVGARDPKPAPYCWTSRTRTLVHTRKGWRWVTRRVRACR